MGRGRQPTAPPVDWRRSSPGVHLLNVDSELGSELDDEALADARRHAILPTITLDPGPWEPAWLSDVSEVNGKVNGFLVLRGGLTSDISIAGRVCTRLIGPGELVLLDDVEVNSIPTNFSWSVLMPARLVIFDERLLLIGRRWPDLLSAILHRCAQTTRNGLVQQAISQLPRVEDRLLALLWTLADRQGVVRADGVWLNLPATHALLATMIGARRPTVSLALHALTNQGCLRAKPGGWLINPSSLNQLTLTTETSHKTPVRSAGPPQR